MNSLFSRDISSAEALFFFLNGKIWSSSFDYTHLTLSRDKLIELTENNSLTPTKSIVEFYSKRNSLDDRNISSE